MQVDYLVLADAAEAANGKLYIHGAGWDTIWAASFPVSHPQAAVAIRLRVAWHETNEQHSIMIDLLDGDGNSILPSPPGPVQGTLNIGRPPNIEVGDDQVVPIVVNLNSISFAGPGNYVVVLRLDGVDVARSPFRVKILQTVLAAQMS